MIFSFVRYTNILIWVLATLTVVYSFSSNVTNQQALISIKASITTDPLGVLSSWNNSIHFCHWKGVTCSHRGQRVTALNLSSLHLMGTLSPYIGNLSFLREVYFNDNNLHGSIPNEIGRLMRLQYLSLANNSFQGEFPANLSHCVHIEKVSMSGNHFQGKLPTEFASWPKLDWFDLGNNHFTGLIPPSIGNISSLRNLDLRRNNLVGSIPFELAYLEKLKVLDLSTNSLSGIVPHPLYNISSLYAVDLNSNHLQGTLPADIGFTLPMLRWFYAGHNRFSGLFPPSITNASNLVIFDIVKNNIKGPLPRNWGNIPNLRVLSFGLNQLGSTNPHNDLSFFQSLANCTRLYALALSENGFRGDLSNSILNLSTTIEILDLSRNNIYGSIPQEIGKFVNMKLLALSENFLRGTLPESIGKLTKLGSLVLDMNHISGVIPASIGNITLLGDLSLEDNVFQGSIPTELFNISTLRFLNLFNNFLEGRIPEQIAGISYQCVFLYLDQNLFTGPLPYSIGSLKQLVELYVSDNKLSGDVPPTLGDCVMLEELHMKGNLFQGKIPSSFKNLKSLLNLDLSCNNITESIPNFIEGFHLIEFLNLSHNNLGGEVPKEGLFSNISRFSIVGNLWLCGGLQALQLPACPLKISRNKKKTFPMKIKILLVILPLAILLGCLAFIFYQHRKSKMINTPSPILQDSQYPRISYQDLLLATDDFSLSNLLGEGRYGSVYKGTLPSPERTIAVKVLNVELNGANKSFFAECETLKNIRHRNLIKIITTCSSTDFKGNDFKALVFEFMTNGSLDSWLHPSPSYQGYEKNLTLLQRLNISIDVAFGLDHLHRHSHTSIVHCDIKPSNILLNENFIACVGDFGLARFSVATTSDINQAQTSSTGVRGTVGYVPPEYGMGGEISVEGDVYSYGIFILELFSGKRPTSSSILVEDNNNLHNYVSKALQHRVMDIADPRMVLDQEDHVLTVNQSYSMAIMELCIASIFEVGILCSVEIPKERINIGVAIKKLHMARDKLLQRGK